MTDPVGTPFEIFKEEISKCKFCPLEFHTKDDINQHHAAVHEEKKFLDWK